MATTITPKEVLKILEKSNVRNTVIVDIRCMNNKFTKIKELFKNDGRFKVFYGGDEEKFDNMVKTFRLQKRNDLIYGGKRLTSRVACRITNYYLSHYRNRKF